MDTLRRALFDSLRGPLTLVARDDALVGVYCPGHRVEPERALAGDEVTLDDPLLSAVAGQLGEYLAGERTHFDVPVAPEPRSDLEGRVWGLLQEIDFGTTTTYGALARELGDPHLAQAVGGAVGRNPVSIIVGCHRVLGSDGSYTGFAGGERRKAWLLGLEAHVSGRSLFAPEWAGE